MGTGRCYGCDGVYSDRAILKHIRECIAPKYGLERVSDSVTESGVYHIKVCGKYDKRYFLYLLVDKCVLLSELDRYLRDIWLECCGHLSCFEINELRYEDEPDADYYNDAESMDTEIGDVLDRGMTFSYEYDFGSTTTLELKVVDIYKPKNWEKGIRLVSRNSAVEFQCECCDNVAVISYFDPCEGDRGMVCGECMDKMKVQNEELIFDEPVNSPRIGICGYEGPADDIPFMKHKKAKAGKGQKPAKNRIKAEAFLDKIMNGNVKASDIGMDADLERVLSGLMGLVDKDTHARSPFTVNKRRLKKQTLQEYLMCLLKDELDIVCRNHGLEHAFGLKKEGLARFLFEYLSDHLEDVLAFIPEKEYKVLVELTGEPVWELDPSEEMPDEYVNLRHMGLLLLVEDALGKQELLVPAEIRDGLKALALSNEWKRKRELSIHMERVIVCVFFYWGIVKKQDLFMEAAKLLNMAPDDTLYSRLNRVLGYLLITLVDKERIGSAEFYFLFADKPAQQVISESWQKASYPEIPVDAVDFTQEDWIDYSLQNPYLRDILYFFLDYQENSGDDELDQDDVLDAVSDIMDYVLNTRPETTVEQFGREFDLAEIFKLDPAIKKLFKNLLIHSPNYWLKGNAISGAMHVDTSVFKKKEEKREDKNNKINATEKAASRWKVGRNDLCPCGSGKKYKNCCLNVQ